MWHEWRGGKKKVYRLLVGKPEGKRPLGRPRRRWMHNIKTNLVDLGCGCGESKGVTQDRDSWSAIMNGVLNFPVL
jgi:hypothetical protein